MRLCLVDNESVENLEPLTLTRPASDLRLGAWTLGERIARAVGVGPGPARRGLVVRPHLEAVQRERDPRTAVNDPDWISPRSVAGRGLPMGAAGRRRRTPCGWTR